MRQLGAGACALVAACLAATAADAGPSLSGKPLGRLPVREVTVFKDGHAFVLHAGRMATDEAGNVVLDQLPSPVIGTFWPYVAERRAKLAAVTASARDVSVERKAVDLRQLIAGNPGASVMVTESKGASYKATILDLPGPDRDGQGAAVASVVLFETEGGTKVVRLDQIQDIRFTGPYRRTVADHERRNLLTLRLDWNGKPQQAEAEVGLVYLQRGLRWIPGYRVAIDGKGRAVVKLQATLVNELTDLDDVTAHLVVGVPSFAFADTLDPISLQQAVAELSQSFRQDARTAFAFSNAIMTQQLAAPVSRGPLAAGSAGVDLGPDVAESGGHEDLFVFSLEHVSLRKGDRAVVPIAELSLRYRDVFALDLPFTPPPELWRNLDSSRQAELARVFGGSRVSHRIRLSNSSAFPLTTAPALILRDERLLAQGLMTYAAPGAEADLTITPVVDIGVRKEEHETKRVPNAATWHGESFGRVDLAGSLTLTSYRKEPVEVEVTRHVLGNLLTADNGGRTEMVNVLEDAMALRSEARPPWWDLLAWPWWWTHWNAVSRVTWTVTLEPKEPVTLGYTWNYFWR